MAGGAHHHTGLLLGVLVLFIAFLLPAGVEGRVRYNSQVVPSNGIKWADFNGDGADEFYLHESDKLYITTTEFTVHGLSFNKLNTTITRTFHGKFANAAADTLCAQHPNPGSWPGNRFYCYYNQAGFRQVWRMYMGDFIGSQDIIVGDFNGDNLDDLLTYQPSTGAIQVYKWNASLGYFDVMANWATSVTLTNRRIFAGQFSSDARTDLAFYNPSTRQLSVYLTQTSTSGLHTSALWFTTPTNWAGVNEEIRVADLDGDGFEDLVRHNTATGAYTFLDVSPGTPGLHNPVAVGDMLVHPNTTSAFFGRFRTGADRRDDSMVLVTQATPVWARSDARNVSGGFSYVRMYTQYTLILNNDQDGDRIKTRYELGGFDPNNDGVSNEPLHSYGASPFQRDVFVEVDYMAPGPSNPWNYSMRPLAVARATAIFAEKGINLHIFVDDQIPYQQNLGNPTLNWATHFDPIKSAWFTPGRQNFFYYNVWANAYNADTSSGIARGIPAQDFLVTLGDYTTNIANQVGTFLHELGHCLGLRHGGNENTNRKPNHLSIMNYNYQFSGIRKNGLTSNQHYYSEIVCNALSEGSLNENAGVTCGTGTNTYQTLVYNGNRWTNLNVSFDWNNNGVINNPVSYDTNDDGSITSLTASFNEYAALNFNGIPLFAKRTVPENEELLWEPPMEDIPPAEDEDESDLHEAFTHHDGIQFLSLPSDTIPSDLPDDLRAALRPSASSFSASSARLGPAPSPVPHWAIGVAVPLPIPADLRAQGSETVLEGGSNTDL